MAEEDDLDPLDLFFSTLVPGSDTVPLPARDEEDEEEIRVVESTKKSVSYFELVAESAEPQKQLSKFSGEKKALHKNIYVQVRSITEMTEEEISGCRERQGIRVRGKQVPRLVSAFSQCGLLGEVLRYMENRLNIKTPTAIQMQAIPALLTGRDVIAISPTGSGKTLAYGLPLVRRVAEEVKLHSPGVVGVVLGPTRELVRQIGASLTEIAKMYGLELLTLYGGDEQGYKTQVGQISHGKCHVIVSTPARLVDVFSTCKMSARLSLETVSFLVLDECDRMLDLGFSVQLTNILNAIHPNAQKALFSATFPRVIESVARRHLHKPLEVLVGRAGAASASVRQFVEVFSSDEDKFGRLLELLGEWQSQEGTAIVFCASKEQVDDLFVRLHSLGYSGVRSLYSGQDQTDRGHTLDEFRDERSSAILLTTSLSARGIDCPHVKVVINFACPDHYEDYVHRIGRTGRAGQFGFAYTFLVAGSSDEDHAQDLVDALKSANQSVDGALLKLAQTYAHKLALGQVARPRKWRGFKGRGFTFDVNEALNRPVEHASDGEVVAEAAPVKAASQGMPALAASRPPAAAAAAPPPPPPPPGRPPGQTMAVAVAVALPAALPVAVPVADAGDKMASLVKKGVRVTPPPAGFLVEELEINDYPTVARLRANARDLRRPIEESWGVRLTVKGEFYKKGEKIPAGCRRLFVEITGKDREAVKRAKQELFEAVEEIAIAAFYASKRK